MQKKYFFIAVILLFKSITVLTVYREGNEKNEKYIHIHVQRDTRHSFFTLYLNGLIGSLNFFVAE